MISTNLHGPDNWVCLEEQSNIFHQSCPQMDPKLATLPSELIHLVAGYLRTKDLCSYAATCCRNWDILQDTCHKEAVRVAGPTYDDYRKHMATWDPLNLVQVQKLYRIWEKKSLLIDAVSTGHLNAVRSFLDHGISPNSHNIYGKRLFHLAITIFRLPKRFPYELYWMTVRWRPCHEEGMSEAYEMIKLLLSYGADPSLSDVDDPDTTPLSLAAELGMNELVCLLINSGANVRQKGVLGKVCAYCDLEVLQFALDVGGDINDVDSGGSTLLYHAAKNKDVEVIKYLLQAGLANQINTPNRKGKTPLLKAIMADKSDNVVVLAEHGADVNIVHPSTFLPALHIACGHWMSFVAVSALIDAGADLNREAAFGSRPLHAAMRGKVETVRAILQSGKPFDIAARNSILGNTALHCAIDPPWRPKSWRRDVVRMLLAAGAPKEAENYFGCTPIDMAFEHKEFEFVYWMLTRDLEFCEDDSMFDDDEKARWLHDHQTEYEELKVLGLINLEPGIYLGT
ncbi:F-box domain and ankyrin repeat protein [Talaromyces stipitatus ATCC 10500]|uniref:F-box domain and ankyrin repeat protein n=1 Tax=Talaromyces stipitatus (strain ATCC 10500 / CBS 375.48 / QM 6759 / NRRL 1006) TaxID=441959 RepID=B8M116_TALSN|nr:F-box domain and ankyrin repeat protein [Talaromyces stipitatus ATCC 10500]EED21796.1 F-box domain and ankyrin repeat protein [Talaromyces stipitatus ATCC 10500]